MRSGIRIGKAVTGAVAAALAGFAPDVAPPAMAQERTLTAAHDFIQTMFNNRPKQVAISRFRGASDETGDTSTSQERFAYLRTSDCTATVWSFTGSQHNIGTEIDWSSVSQVDRSRTNGSFVRVNGGSRTFSMVGFRLPSEADATRVEAAMEYLRQGCARASAF